MIIDIALGILLAIFLLATIAIWLPILLGITAVAIVIVVLVVAAIVVSV